MVMTLRRLGVVARAVHLYREFLCGAVEVQHIRTYAVLASEFSAVELATLQMIP